MVYSIGVRYPYPINIGTSFPEASEDADRDVAFLNPEGVDTVSFNRKRALTSGYPVDPATVPTKLRWESRRYDPTDFVVSRSTLVVSERVREIIERFEPGVHQLLPVAIYRPKSGEPIACYYWFVVCNLIDSVDRVHTTLKQGGRFGGSMWNPTGSPDDRLVFNLNAIGAAHVWRDPNLIGEMCSDELFQSLRNAGVTGLDSTKYEQV